MASLSLKHIYKVYEGNKTPSVNDFCMEIEDKEFIVFVGPSGCGKSTTLRMIAGLEEITAGELMIGDEVVNDVEPKDRNIAMVFQNYALYPHMTVRENMAFALRLRKDLSEEEIMARVDEAAKKLDIAQFLDRKPRALSGGQRQRVSLGRAIVRDPKVFLLDEPLSNLDAKLRAQMRTEISKLHKQLQTTFIYVTHDQVEAMTMGTRIVVMKLGVVQQIDTPKNLYDYPGNKFVAGFIGTPQMNFFAAKLRRVDVKTVEVIFGQLVKDESGVASEAAKARGEEDKMNAVFPDNPRTIRIPAECVVKVNAKYLDGETPVLLGIRPEDVHVEADYIQSHPECVLQGTVGIIEALGSESIVYCDLDPATEEGVGGSRIVTKVDPRAVYSIDQPIKVAIDPTRIHLFDFETDVTIMPRVPAVNEMQATVHNGVATIQGMALRLPAELALQNGEYTFAIPSDAFRFGGCPAEAPYDPTDSRYTVSVMPVEAKYQKGAFTAPIMPVEHSQFAVAQPTQFPYSAPVKGVEQIGKTVLLRLAFGAQSVFAVGHEGVGEPSEIAFDIDWKKVSVLGDDSDVPALNLVNVLHGKMVKERTGKKTFNFGIDIAGQVFYSTQYVQQKMFNAAGRAVFDTKLDCNFSPYAVKLADKGIAAAVTEIRDYGAERFALCQVDTNVIAVYLRDTDNVQEGDRVYLSIDLADMGIVESDRGIRVI